MSNTRAAEDEERQAKRAKNADTPTPTPNSSGAGSWTVPNTSDALGDGGSWKIVDGFATREECESILAGVAGLPHEQKPFPAYRRAPLGVDYRSVEASSLGGAVRVDIGLTPC